MKKSKSLIEEHGVRNTKGQKTSFIQHLCAVAASGGYVSEIEQKKSSSRNVVVGDLNAASVIFTAHYDTPSASIVPSFIFPKMPWLTTLSRIAVGLAAIIPAVVLFFAMVFILPAMGASNTTSVLISILASAVLFAASMIFVVGGKARKNNANSNTSGVRALLKIMEDMPENLRYTAAFAFLDNQENGYLGAQDFIKKHKNILKDKLIINLDSVGVGENVVLALSGGIKNYEHNLKNAFVSCCGFNVEFLSGSKHIPSDHIKFKHSVGVSVFKKTSGGTLYLNNITTSGDTLCNDANIDYISGASINFIKLMNGAAPEVIKIQASAAEEAPKETEAQTSTAEEAPEINTEAQTENTAE